MKKLLVLFFATLLFLPSVFSQGNLMPLNVRQAYEKGTRSTDGYPGPEYWQNHADYSIDVTVDTATDRLSGTATITYFNESPDSLRAILLRLYPDFFRKGNARQWPVPDGDLMDGVSITRLVIDGKEYDPDNDFPRWWITNFQVRLKSPITPGSKAIVEIDWAFDLPTVRGLRMRKYGKGHYLIAYWYPQIAVYDDVDGWDRSEYTGLVEFYNDINNFDVNITVPGDLAVWATGLLQNMEEVYQPGIIERYNQAKESDEVIRIITQEDLENKKVLVEKDKHTWKFKAEAVPDFSFALSNKSNWDAASVVVDKESGRRVFTDAVYPDGSDNWKRGAEVTRASVEYMSYELPGWPFPYPHMTSFWSGGRGGGMETPMMANNGAPRRFQDFVELLFHEAAHTYFPFYLGTNERKYAWMDEGWAAYLPAGMVAEYIPESDYLAEYMDSYTSFAGQEAEMPLMILSYQHNNFSSARVAAYTRPAMAYHFLRDALGHEIFKKGLHEYIRRWQGKHPLPYDFFNTFNDVTGEDLSWFWQPWFYEFGYPDLAIKEVRENNEVVIEKIGNIPIPISLYYISEDNQSEKFYFNTATWKDGKSEFVVKLSPELKIKSLELGNEHIPDVDLENNRWSED